MRIKRLGRGAPILLLGVLSCADTAPTTAPVQQVQHPVVYGEDDRMEVYAHPDEALRELTRQAIVSRVSRSSIDRSDPESFVLGRRTLGEVKNLCEGERFADQIRAGGCSGTLIGVDTVLTAGHCISDATCLSQTFVFDRFYRAEGELETVTAEDVYPCRRVIVGSTGELDYAVVELDRRVTPDRIPVPIRVVEPIPVDTPLTMIGFPSNIPAKIDTGGRVIAEGEAPWTRLDATVDAFGGNSGSGVFDEARSLVAILVSGRTDYIERGECQVVNRLGEDVDNAEDLVYVGRAMEALCDAEPLHDLCEPAFEGGSWCDTCVEAADCREGWTCDGTCRAPCEGDDDCRSNHACADGFCAPRTRLECREDGIWRVPACAPSTFAQDCGPEMNCIEGECLLPSPGDRCEMPLALIDGENMYVGQTEEGFSNSHQGSCGGRGPEAIYALTLDEPAQLTASATGFDTLLYLRRDCDGMDEIACNDDRARGERHALLQVALDAGTYHLFVDGYNGAGEYALEVTLQPECARVCVAGNERCTDAGRSECAAGPDGCLVWSDPVLCGDAEQCVDGECVARPEGDICANTTPLNAENAVIAGDLTEYAATQTGTCGGAGAEPIFEIQVAEPTRLQATLQGAAPVLYVRTECDAAEAEVTCGEAQDESSIDVVLPAGASYLIVDTQAVEAGAFTLTVDFDPDCAACAIDAGVPDAGLDDVGVPDAGLGDAGLDDAGLDGGADANLPDAQLVDAAPLDAGIPDQALPIDAGPDVRPLDAQIVDARPIADAATADAAIDADAPPDASVNAASNGCATTTPRAPGWALVVLFMGVLRRRSSRACADRQSPA